MPRATTPSTYLKLVKRFPLRSVRTDTDLDAATAVLRDLLRQDLDEGGRDYLDALTDLVESYEARAYPVPDAALPAVLRMLMDSNGFDAAELARRSGVPAATITGLLRGTRGPSVENITALARVFHVRPGVFLPAA